MNEARKREISELMSRDPQQVNRVLSEEIARGDGEDADLRHLLGVSHFRLGDFPAAESEFRIATSLDSTSAETFYYLGLSLERQGRSPQAVKAYRTAAALNPGLRQAHEKLQALAGEADPNQTPARVERPPVASQRDSELGLPRTPEEFAEYERIKRQKAIIDARAEYSASLIGMPGWAKVVTAIGVIVVAGIFAFVIWGFIGDPTGIKGDISRDQQAACESARKNGLQLPPWCDG